MVKVDLSFKNPIFTIIAGFIVTVIVAIISGRLHLGGVNLIGPVLGGFIATYFAKEKKMRYGLYEGICVMILLILIIVFGYGVYTGSLFWYVVSCTIIIGPFFASIGGFLGKVIAKRKTS